MISFIEFFNQKKVVNRDWVKIRRSDYEKYFETVKPKTDFDLTWFLNKIGITEFSFIKSRRVEVTDIRYSVILYLSQLGTPNKEICQIVERDRNTVLYYLYSYRPINETNIVNFLNILKNGRNDLSEGNTYI